jgi:hypothetical protein
MDVKEIGGGVWTGCVWLSAGGGGGQRQAGVNKVMKRRVPDNAEKFVCS